MVNSIGSLQLSIAFNLSQFIERAVVLMKDLFNTEFVRSDPVQR